LPSSGSGESLDSVGFGRRNSDSCNRIALTTLPVYYAGRRSTTDGSLFGLNVEQAERLSTRIDGIRSVAALNLSPVPADIVSYGAGIAQVQPKSFVPGFLFGEAPYTLAFISIGASLQSLTFETTTLSPELLVLTAAGAVVLCRAVGINHRSMRCNVAR
jgi:uncharacterized membrane protein YdjX (TVP38/TMEM64 family)